MFSVSKPKKKLNSTPTDNVRKTARKPRSDKKHDIRIPVSPETKKTIRLLAQNSISVTQYCTGLITEAIDRQYDFPSVQYVNYDEVVHAKVTKEQYDQLYSLMLKWNFRSIRQTAQRILLGMIMLEEGEIFIEKL